MFNTTNLLHLFYYLFIEVGGEYNKENKGQVMVLTLAGNLEIGAHIGSILCSLICLRHWIRSRAVTNRVMFPKSPIFISAQHVLVTI